MRCYECDEEMKVGDKFQYEYDPDYNSDRIICEKCSRETFILTQEIIDNSWQP
jgi:uncharacterized CHY-type Zn-finger protein